MKLFSIILLTLGMTHSASAMTFAETVASSHDQFVTGALGITRGGISFAAEYERKLDRLIHWGGYLRIEPKGNGAPSITSIGAFARPHIYERNLELYISPGFGLHMIDNGTSETVLGPSLSVGALYQLNDKMAVGFDNMKIYGWTANTLKGLIADSFLVSFKYAL